MNENRNKVLQEEKSILIPLSLIEIDSNIRKEYKDEDITELSESIKKFGQLQPTRVYERGDKYVILFGHRRYFAAKKAKFINLNCFIVPEPESTEKIYIQITENEQKEELSPEDREAYIMLLKDKGESYETIAKNINKSVSWVRECSVAFNVREKNSKLLINSGLVFGTKEAYALRNATEEEVEKALNDILENPAKKNGILQDFNIRTKKKNSGKTHKKQVDNKIIIEVNCDEKKKTVSFKNESTGPLNEHEIKGLLHILSCIYTNKGYSWPDRQLMIGSAS